MRKRKIWTGVQMAPADGVGTGKKGAIAVPKDPYVSHFDSMPTWCAGEGKLAFVAEL